MTDAEPRPAAFVRPAFQIRSAQADERRRRKEVVRAIHIGDEAFQSTRAIFDEMLNRSEDGGEQVALVIAAPSGAGKTHILEHLATDPRLAAHVDGHGPVTPLLRVSAPAPCTLKTLGLALVYALTGKMLSTKLHKHDIWTRVRTNMFSMGVRVVMIDELHHVFDNATLIERRDIISTLKALLIEAAQPEIEEFIGALPPTVATDPIGLVLSGMPYLREVIALDLQLQRRCRFRTMTPLGQTTVDSLTFKGFMQRYAQRLDFSAEPDFTSIDMLLRLHKASGGYRGRAAFLIKEAAFLAIDRGDQTVDREKHLGEVFERIYETGPERNPFLVADVKKIGRIKELECDQLTLLKGRRRTDEVGQ